MHHLYSLHDFKVIGQFSQAFKGGDPLLEEAFELFSKARYGLSISELFPEGVFNPPDKLFGTENAQPDDTAAFLRFFEDHLKDHAAIELGAGRERSLPTTPAIP
jgi:hypothetical protein